MIRILVLFAAASALTACLKTRSELRSEGSDLEMRKQTSSQQAAQAKEYREKAPPTAYRFEEMDEQMRQLNGRVEAIENHLMQINAAQKGDSDEVQREKAQMNARLLAYEEAIRKLDAQVAALSGEVAKARAQTPASAPAAKGAASSYDEAEAQFKARKWKEAIVAYQKYRDANPKGKKYAESTYKIGLAFAELGMKDEAKVFFEEVRDKFPKSREAKRAAQQLKSLK